MPKSKFELKEQIDGLTGEIILTLWYGSERVCYIEPERGKKAIVQQIIREGIKKV